jgi:hypothetical protein
MLNLSGDDRESFSDDLLDEDGFPVSYQEMLDSDTLKILENYEMESVMNSVETQPNMGQLNVGPNNTFEATFAEAGSSAISFMSYMNEQLTVRFRNSTREYQYLVTDSALTEIMAEVRATLVDAEGSVGPLIQRMTRQNIIQLV